MARKAELTPIGAIEAEIANLDARRTSLEDRRAKAAEQFEAARTARKTALANDPAADLGKLTATVRDLEDEIETLDGVLRDLAEQMDDARRRLAKAKDQDERASVAQSLTLMAGSVDDAAAKLAKALDAVGDAYAGLLAEIPTEMEIVRIGDRTTDAAAIARAILAEGLAAVCPGAFQTRGDGSFAYAELSRASRFGDAVPSGRFSERVDVQKVLDTETAARLLVSDRLRFRALAVEEGRTSPSLSDRDLPRSIPRLVDMGRNAA